METDVGLKDKLQQVGFKEKLQQAAADANEYLHSDEMRAHSESIKQRATELAESELGQKVIADAKDATSGVLANLVDGDSPTQAAARVAKAKIDRNKN